MTKIQAEPKVGGKPLVWIVDDEIDLAETYSQYLSIDFETRAFDSAEKAIHAIETGKHLPDALVTDIKMPGISGIALAGKLGEISHGIRPTIIAISGNAQKKDLVGAIEFSVSGFLEKPFAPDLLRRKIIDSLIASQTGKLTHQRTQLLLKKNLILENLRQRYLNRLKVFENVLMNTGIDPFGEDEERAARNEQIQEEAELERKLTTIDLELASLS